MLDGHVKEYNLEDIDEIDFVSRTDNMVMRVYQPHDHEEVFPAAALDKFAFVEDPPGRRVLNATIFGQPHHIPVTDIDSIVFHRLEPKISGCVVVIDANNVSGLVAIDETSITLSSSSPLSKDIAADCMVISEPIQLAPYGFVRKITGLSSSGSYTVVHTSEGALTDVIEDGVVAFQVSFSVDDAEKIYIDVPRHHEKTDTTRWFRITFEKEILTGLKFIGDIKFQPGLDFYMIIEDFSVRQFSYQVKTKNLLELKAESELKSELVKYKRSLNELMGIPRFELPSIKVMIGPVPFVVTSAFDMQVGCDISIAAKVTASYSAESTVSYGLSYNAIRAPNAWQPLSHVSFSHGFSPMQLSLGGSIKPFIGPQLNINLYNVPEFFNVYTGIYSYLLLEVNVLNMPLWKLHGGVEAAAGVESKWFPEINYKVPVSFKKETLLAQAQNLIASVTPLVSAIGDTITIKGSWFGSGEGVLDNLSFAAFKFGPTVLPTDMVLANNYASWNHNEIQVVVPDGIPVPTDGQKEIEIDLLLNIQGYYNNWAKHTVAKRPVITRIDPQPFNPGDMVTISGSSFGLFRLNNDYVYFNGVRATSYTWWEDGMIIVEVPDNVESGPLWVVVRDFKSNEITYVAGETDVAILPPRLVTYELETSVTEVEHHFESHARPVNEYRFTWHFGDGHTFSEIVQKGETSKISHRYVNLSDGDIFHPSVELYDLEGKLLATDEITIYITIEPEEEDPADEGITVGKLVWMTKNLDVDVGNNWYPRYRYFINNEWVWITHTEYGRLYDWETALAACPEGWRLPSDADWTQLLNSIGGTSIGGKLKSTHTKQPGPEGHPAWHEPNTGATDEIGFSALPGGSRASVASESTFAAIGNMGGWWSSLELNSENAWLRSITHYYGNVNRVTAYKSNGYSIRCVRDID